MTIPVVQHLRAWLRLCRAEYWGFSVTAPLGALIVAGPELPVVTFAVLFLLNLMTVAWGFAHNDYCDLAIDRNSASKQFRILVRGDIRPARALALTLALIGISLLLAFGYWGWSLPVAVLLGSIIATWLYNRYGKSFPGGDIFYAFAGSLQFLLGAIALAPEHDPAALSAIAWILLGVQFVNHFYFNAVNGGIKDAPEDRKAGVPTLAARSIRERNGQTRMDAGFRAMAMMLSVTTIGLCISAFALGLSWYVWQLVIFAFCAIRSLQLTWQASAMENTDRSRTGQLLMRREMVTTGMIMMLLPAHIGLWWFAVLLVIPFAAHFGIRLVLREPVFGPSRDH